MIDVEIRGPVAKKEYAKLRQTLMSAGEDARAERRVTVAYAGIYAGVLADMEIRDGASPRLVLKDRRLDRETALELAPGQLSEAVKFCASLGYLKGEVSVRDVLSARYGGARFQLVDPDGGESYYYEAVIAAKDPASAKEAKAKLETLARKFKLPLWTDAEMHSFLTQLGKRADYPYDFSVDGPEHFREKFEK